MTYYSRNLVLQHALTVAQAHGVAPDSVLEYCGISEQSAWQTGGFIPTDRLIDLVEHCAVMSRRRDFGLQWGGHADHRSFGTLGIAISQRRTIGRALGAVGEYLQKLNVGYELHMRRDERIATVQMRILAKGSLEPRHYTEGTLLMLVRFVRLLSAGKWSPQVVRFAHPRMAGLHAYERAFGCPALFDQPTTSADVLRSQFEQRFDFEASPVHMMMRALIERHHNHKPTSLPEKVAVILPQLLPGGIATSSRVASLLNMSQRTFQRRLAEEGASFKQIVSDVRESLLREQVEIGSVTGDHLASTLGYSEPSAASRFIRQKLGRTTRELVSETRQSGRRAAS
jgi:AraC-like DNA-binding protein